MISKELLSILCCPETKQDLVAADEGVVAKVNQLIASGSLKNRAGKKITQKIDAGLVRSDRQYLYPVREDIPVMLIDEAISLQSI